MTKIKTFGSGDKASLFYNWYFFAILASGLFIVLSLAGNSTIAGILAFLSLGVSARIAHLDKKNADFDERDHYQDYRHFSKAGLEKRLNPIVAYSLVAFIIDLIVLMSVLPSGFGFSPALFALMFFMALFTCVYLLFFYYTGVTVTINFPTSHGDTVKHDISPVGYTKAVVDTVAEKVDSAVEEVKDDFDNAENDVETADTEVEEPETDVEPIKSDVEVSESHGESVGGENSTEPTLEPENDSTGVLEPSESVTEDTEENEVDAVSEDDDIVSEDDENEEKPISPVEDGFYKVVPNPKDFGEVSESAESTDSPEIEETGDSEDSVDSEELSETAENEGNTEIEGTDGNAENEDTPKVDLFGEVEADPKGGD